MTDAEFSICESCEQPGSLYLFFSATPIQTGWNETQGQPTYTHAIALCVACGQRSGFPRFFDTPIPVPQRASA